MELFFYPTHPVRCILTGTSECGKSVFLTNLILNKNKEFTKIYIDSPILNRDLYQKVFKCFSKIIPIHIIPKILNEEDFDVVFGERDNNEDFEKSQNEIETYESIEQLKFPQENDYGGIFTVDDLNGKEMNDPRVQTLFKRSRNDNLSVFVISQDY